MSDEPPIRVGLRVDNVVAATVLCERFGFTRFATVPGEHGNQVIAILRRDPSKTRSGTPGSSSTYADPMARADIIGSVADRLVSLAPDHPMRVAVDGITAAGKTTLANELAESVAQRGRPALRLSMDGYHHPRAHRYRQGRNSADGYYEDAYNFPEFARLVLVPLGSGGSHAYRQRIIDLPTDETIEEPAILAPAGAILIVDGSFLQRPELRPHWDVVVFVHTDFDTAQHRGSARDAAAFGGVDQARAAFATRYHAANRRYLAAVDPETKADVVIDNNDLNHPALSRI
jgi:uridine kinase